MRYLLVASIEWPLLGQAAEPAAAAAPVKAVLVTGATTGIGRNLTEQLPKSHVLTLDPGRQAPKPGGA